MSGLTTRTLTGRLGRVSISLVLAVFLVHSIIRFAGLWNPIYVPVSMVILWPLPWLFLHKESRYEARFRSPASWTWFLIAPALAVLGTAACAALAWLSFDNLDANWFIQHALALKVSLSSAPADESVAGRFLIVTIPAMIFSPLGEEFFYRGLMLSALELKWGQRTAMLVQASAFSLVHLAHYGLDPFQPALIAVWLPSMFAVALLLGWIVIKSGSVWCAVVAHSTFNLALSVVVFTFLPDVVANGPA